MDTEFQTFQLNLRYSFLSLPKKCDFEIALMTHISSFEEEELQLEFRNSFVHRLGRKPLSSDKSVCMSTSFLGSLFSASLSRWNRDSGCGWSRDHPESGW